jgi:hypothetical protein
MTRLLFTNLTMLAGLGALAVPILIHLLLKQRKQRLRFSTLRFFEKQDEQSSQRRRLRNLLLLALRLLLLALLVLAFARPYLPGGQASGLPQARRLAVFVLDRTASLQATEGGSPRWPRALESIRKILSGLGPDDRAALVVCAAHSEVLSGAAPAEVVTRLLKDLQPGWGTGHLGEALQLARKLVASSGAGYVSSVYVVSDLQLSACQNLDSSPLPQDLEVRPLKVGDVLAPNLAVVDLQLDRRGSDSPHGVIASRFADETKTVKMRLAIDEKEAVNRSVLLATGGVTRVDLTLPPLAPGWHTAAMRIEAEDALAMDNVRYEAFFVPQPIRALVAETRTGRRPFEEESYFIISALDPMHGATNTGDSRFAVEKVLPDELARKLGARQELTNYDLVVLPGLKNIPAGLGRGLADFLQAGGGLLLFLGDEVGAGRYNSEFRDFLPGQLGHLEKNDAEAPDLKWRLEDYDLGSSIFAVFRRPNSGNLALPEFTRRFTIATNQATIVPATFADGTPALAGRSLGRGRVVLVNTSADTAWTDWPKHKTFVPWMHSLCYHLSGRSGPEQMRIAAHLAAADDSEVSLSPTARGQSFRLTRSGAKETAAAADETGRLRNVDFSLPGVYSIRDRAGQVVQCVAVNVPAEEADLTALTPAEFQRDLVRIQEPPPTEALGASLFGLRNNQNELWRILLLVALGLLFVEVFLANRTYA